MLPYRFGDIKQMQKKTLSKHWSLGSLQKLRSPLYPLHLSVINAKHELSRNGQGDHEKRQKTDVSPCSDFSQNRVQMSLDSSLILGPFFSRRAQKISCSGDIDLAEA